MKAVRIKLTQETANYREPIDFAQRRSLPLPPPSTVIGMVHRLAKFEGYKDMDVSIQGRYMSKVEELFTRHEISIRLNYDKKSRCKKCLSLNNAPKKDSTEALVCKKCGSKDVEIIWKVRGALSRGISTPGITQSGVLYNPEEDTIMTEDTIETIKDNYTNIVLGPCTVELLVGVELMLHIIPKDQSLVKCIKEAFLRPWEYPSLGRREDLAVIEDVKIVGIDKKVLKEDIDLDETIAAYIPYNIKDDFILRGTGQIKRSGVIYYLTKNYKRAKIGKNTIRKWNTVKSLYATNISVSEKNNVLLDEDNNIVFAL